MTHLRDETLRLHDEIIHRHPLRAALTAFRLATMEHPGAHPPPRAGDKRAGLLLPHRLRPQQQTGV